MLFPVFSVLNLWNITPTLHVYFTGAVSPFRCRWSSHVCTFRFHRFYTVRKIVYRSNNILQWLVQNWIHQRAMNSVTNNSNCIGFRRYTWFDSITIADTESNFYFKICGLNTNSTSEVQLIFSHKNMKQTFESVYENEDHVNSGSKYINLIFRTLYPWSSFGQIVHQLSEMTAASVRRYFWWECSR